MKPDPLAIVKRKIAQLAPQLHGLGPEVQGAILADLVALWLAGHTPQIRQVVLKNWIGLTTVLVEPNELRLFGKEGHPGGRH